MHRVIDRPRSRCKNRLELKVVVWKILVDANRWILHLYGGGNVKLIVRGGSSVACGGGRARHNRRFTLINTPPFLLSLTRSAFLSFPLTRLLTFYLVPSRHLFLSFTLLRCVREITRIARRAPVINRLYVLKYPRNSISIIYTHRDYPLTIRRPLIEQSRVIRCELPVLRTLHIVIFLCQRETMLIRMLKPSCEYGLVFRR